MLRKPCCDEQGRHMSQGMLLYPTKHDLLARARAGLQRESEEARFEPTSLGRGQSEGDSYQPLISIADSLDHHVQRLLWLARPRTRLPEWVRKRFALFRIPVLERLAVRVHSLLSTNNNEALLETARSLDLISQAFRSSVTCTPEFHASQGRSPAERHCIRVGWISAYNSMCGIAEYSRFLLKYFDSSRFEVKVYAEQMGNPGSRAYEVERCWERHSSSSLASLASRIVSDGIHCVVIQFQFAFFHTVDMQQFLQRLRQSGVRSLVILHSTPDSQDSVVRMSEALGSCDRVLVHTRNDVDRLRSMGAANNLTYFPHGAPFRKFRSKAEQRERLGLNSYDIIIGSYGFLLPHKGIRELIRALPLILERHPRVLLLLVNSVYPTPASSQERYLCQQEIESSNLQRNVVIVDDFLDPEESLFLLEACDLLVFPYQDSQDSHSGAINVGLAAGRPVLATDVSIFHELRDVAQFLPGRGHREIAAGVLEFIADSSLEQRARSRQLKWLEEHDWQKMSVKLQKLIEASVNNGYGD